MKKIITLLLVCSMVVSLGLSGCSKPVDTSNSSSSNAPVTLSMLWQGTDTLSTNYWKSCIQAYQVNHSNVTINYDAANAGTDMDTKLNTMLASGTSPDLISVPVSAKSNRILAGQLEPLDNYWNTFEGKDDFLPNLLEVGKSNGKLYIIPVTPGPNMLAYRTDMFKTAGITSPPTTWEEFKNDAIKLTLKDAKGNITQGGFDFPITATGSFQATVFNSFLFQDEGSYQDADGNPTIDTTQAADVLNYFNSFIPDVTIPYGNDPTSPFFKGNSAMAFVWCNQIPLFSKEPLNGNVAIAPPTTHKTGGTHAGMALLGIGSASKNKDAAWDFLAYVNSKDQVWARYKQMLTPVTRKSLEDLYESDNSLNSMVSEWLAVGKPMPCTLWASTYVTNLTTTIGQVLLKQKETAPALKDLQALLNAEVAKEKSK